MVALTTKDMPLWVYELCITELQSSQKGVSFVAASGPTIWTSTYGLEPMLYSRLLIEPSDWAKTVRMFTQRCT